MCLACSRLLGIKSGQCGGNEILLFDHLRKPQRVGRNTFTGVGSGLREVLQACNCLFKLFGLCFHFMQTKLRRTLLEFLQIAPIGLRVIVVEGPSLWIVIDQHIVDH
ncbi:hypothetical protein D3C85_1546480 [compost metagenome]